ADVLEEIWARDVADLAWDVLRFRRYKTRLIQSGWGANEYIGNFSRFACEIERIERVTAAAEARRDGILREVERRRDHVAERLRRRMEEIEEAEFRELPPAKPESAAG